MHWFIVFSYFLDSYILFQACLTIIVLVFFFAQKHYILCLFYFNSTYIVQYLYDTGVKNNLPTNTFIFAYCNNEADVFPAFFIKNISFLHNRLKIKHEFPVPVFFENHGMNIAVIYCLKKSLIELRGRQVGEFSF